MRVLVTAASKHGATAEIAEVIAQALSDRGVDTTVAEPTQVSSVEQYDAVVLGSAVYAGHWLEPAKTLVERCAPALRARPVWLFSSGPVGEPPKPSEDAVDVHPMMASTRARGHTVFAGRLDRHRLGFGERAVVAALRAPEGDFRDWAAIQAFAARIAEQLVAAPVR